MDIQQDMNNTNTTPQDGEQGGFGPMVGILIIAALLIFGGLYFWGSHLTSDDGEMMDDSAPQSFEVTSSTVEDGGTMTDEEFEALFDDSAPTDAVDATLETAVDDLSDLDTLDAELDALDAEL